MGIFGILEYSEPLSNYILTYIQKPVTFTKIGRPCVTLEIQSPDILTVMEYLELSKIWDGLFFQSALF